jgi:predicted phage tail protein
MSLACFEIGMRIVLGSAVLFADKVTGAAWMQAIKVETASKALAYLEVAMMSK